LAEVVPRIMFQGVNPKDEGQGAAWNHFYTTFYDRKLRIFIIS
jgi:hypothetical protein